MRRAWVIIRLFVGWALVAAASVTPLCAAPDTQAHAHYLEGRYAAAAARAEERGGADNLALAARAFNAVAYFEEDRLAARRAAMAAMAYAERALREDGDHVEAHLQRALALAVRGANMNSGRAFLLGLPRRSRSSLDRALALEPQNAWALSSSAAWRLEVARRGGAGVYGADPNEGYAEFAKARAVSPDNVVIAFEMALRLLASGRDEWREDAIDALEAALAGEPGSVFERGVQRLARDLRAAIDEGPPAERAFIAALR